MERERVNKGVMHISRINLSDTEDLVTVMTCNEIFNPDHPDTFFEKVVQ